MPAWFLFALLGHLANGAAFVVDKTLLRSSFKRPATYAALIGMLSVMAVVLFPFGVHVPSASGGIFMVIAGVTFVVSLWAFFGALAQGEASRVVPIIGSLIPIVTLVGTSLFLGERLSAVQGVGFAALLIATVILSGGGGKGRLRGTTVGIAVLAAVLFAVSSVAIKAAYEADGFITTFAISRLCAAVMGAGLLFIDRRALQELLGSSKKKAPKGTPISNPLLWVIAAQALGGIGFLGVQYATSLGSASLVNALQAVQYAFLVVIAFALHARMPALLGEDIRVAVVIRKGIAIMLVGIGLWLIV